MRNESALIYDEYEVGNVSGNDYNTGSIVQGGKDKMNSKKLLAAGLTALMSVSMLAGCSGGEAKTDDTPKGDTTAVTLTVWAPQEDLGENESGWLFKELNAFKEAHPEWDLTFKTGVCSEGDAGTMIPQDAEAAADVYLYANDQIPKLLDAGGIAELGGKTADDIKANNGAVTVGYVTYDGGIYGVPFTTNTWFMFYDKRVYSEDDVKNLDTMLEKGTVAFPLTNSWYIASFYLANGCTMFGPNGSDNDAGIDFGGEKGAAVTNYLVDLVKNPNFKNDADGVGIAGLGDGSVAAIFSGSWDYGNVVNALGEENVGVAVLPTITIDGEKKQMLSFAGVKAIGVNPNSANMEQAVALAAFLGSTQAQQDHFDMRAIVPTDKNVKAEGNPMVEVQNAVIETTSFPQPFVAGMGNYWTPAQTLGENLVNGTITHDNAAEETEKTNSLFSSSMN